MYKRNYIHFLRGILNSSEKILSLIKDSNIDEFINNWVVLDAIVRNLEIIGEAIKNIPSSIKEKYPDIEWKKIAGLRDILTHEYFGINYNILWDIVKNKIPKLTDEVQKILNDLEKNQNKSKQL
jgi:uncharacterized protein with HEPN domain